MDPPVPRRRSMSLPSTSRPTRKSRKGFDVEAAEGVGEWRTRRRW
jgi:hypothetical protein